VDLAAEGHKAALGDAPICSCSYSISSPAVLELIAKVCSNLTDTGRARLLELELNDATHADDAVLAKQGDQRGGSVKAKQHEEIACEENGRKEDRGQKGRQQTRRSLGHCPGKFRDGISV
jgi:hypothetical protein